ncbi:MAG TPA: glycosyltransferase, partial [Albitalea sp.]
MTTTLAGPRIGFLGNVCNLFYDYAQRLRDDGRDAHLFLVKRFAQEDPFQAYGLPPEAAAWIHARPWRGRYDWEMRPDAPDVAHLKSCATLHGQGRLLTWALKADRPYVWQPYGSDFYSLPFPAFRLSAPLARMTPRLFAANVSSAIEHHYTARHFRSAIAHASRIVITGWFDRHWIRGYRMLERLGRLDAVFPLPFPIDCRTFSPAARKNAWPEPALQSRLDAFDVVAFYPSRQLFTAEGKRLDGMRADDPGKRNDAFYRGLAKARRRGANVGVVIVDKANPDTPAAKALIESLGIADAVVWIPAMPRVKLVDWYRAADLVVDCFGGGAPGSISFEAMACGTPVMQWIDFDAGREWGLDASRFYEKPVPVLNCRTEDEIAETFESHSRAALNAAGREARQWALENVDLGAALAR